MKLNDSRLFFILIPVCWVFLSLSIFAIACSKEEVIDFNDLSDIPFLPEEIILTIPQGFQAMDIPKSNTLTKDGILLGRRLFFDPLLSKDLSLSCSSCHLPSKSFTDGRKTSKGFMDQEGTRSSMSLLNVGFYSSGLFWDGRTKSLEEQALLPVEDPVEMHELWPNVVTKLRQDAAYPTLFRKAFGITTKSEITKDLVAKAISQFERTLISSGNSKYDRVIRGEDVFSDQELAGYNIFFDIDPDIRKHAECGHCHNAPLFTTNEFVNNGLEDTNSATLKDKGLGTISLNPNQNGFFRIPTLRNISFTAPYMHDGRFENLMQVLDHYTLGGHPSRNLSPILRPLNLTQLDKEALISFIMTLNDLDFLNNPNYQSPF